MASTPTNAGESNAGRIARGLVAGVIAGAVASCAMDQFQAVVSPLLPENESDPEPATEKAAGAVATAITGRTIPAADKPLAGQAVHYAIGIALGAAYGVAAEFRPSITAGYGTAFGVGTATILDEAAVPATGLGSAPWKAGIASNLYSYASHLVFGCVSEIVRRQVASTLKPRQAG
ncbi:DUF1440 domain-containing protein [Sphingomonas sp. ID0503]|uniref:DUF1440 domain-containing protein n=1 Tax=Sphingomonas sp. ID0503 TaxID=3399691 RepID=UPI003AFA4DEA